MQIPLTILFGSQTGNAQVRCCTATVQVRSDCSFNNGVYVVYHSD